MWLDKFLDLDDLEEDSKQLTDTIMGNLEKKRLSPLEFTILETIFNARVLSTNDLLLNLNRHFAGTFEAKEGTVKPILSKLKKRGFLETKKVKSPMGPLKKVNYLTEAGKEILKTKVSNNFEEQIRFIENFLIELSAIYIKAFPEKQREERMIEVQELIQSSLNAVKTGIYFKIILEGKCPACQANIDRKNSNFCPVCGARLIELPTDSVDVKK